MTEEIEQLKRGMEADRALSEDIRRELAEMRAERETSMGPTTPPTPPDITPTPPIDTVTPAPVPTPVIDSTPKPPEPPRTPTIDGRIGIEIKVVEAEKEIKKEIKDLSKEEKEKLEVGLNNIGFWVEKKKNEFFAGIFNHFAESQLDQNKTTSRFTKNMAKISTQNAKIAEQKMKEVSSGKEKHRAGNVARLVGNIFKYGRLVTDAVGYTATAPLRYVMMAGMAFTQASEAAKETRLENEEVIEQTRIADAEHAAEEAWRIYERAQEKINDSSGINMSAEALKNAYLMEMPKDLKKRLENPGVANGMVQAVIKKDLKFTIDRLNQSLDKIDSNPKLSIEEKDISKEKLLKKWEKNLQDYDRLVTQYGTVDGLAMAGLYAQTAGGAVVAAVTVETIFLSVEKLLGSLAHAQTAVGAHIGTTHHAIQGVKTDDTRVGTSGHVDSLHKVPTTSVTSQDTTLSTQHDSVKTITDSLKSTVDTTKVVNPATVDSMATAGKGVKEILQTHTDNIGHSLDHPTEFQIGKEPGAVGDAWRKILLDHNLPGKLPADGIVLDHNEATRALNEAANLQRLMDGHDTAGITVAQFHEAVSVHDDIIEIKDPAKLYAIVDHFHEHSKTLLDNGVFKDSESASGYVNNISQNNWHQEVLGTNMHGTPDHPGILGHPGVKPKQIENFSNLPRAHGAVASAEDLRTQLLAKMDNLTPPEPHVTDITGSSVLDSAPKTLSPENILRDHGNGAITGIDAPTNIPGGTFEQLTKTANSIYENNIQHMFPRDPTGRWPWDMIKDGQAAGVYAETEPERMSALTPLFHKINEVTGLKPKSGNWFRLAETNEGFMKRGFQAAAKMGQWALDKLKI